MVMQSIVVRYKDGQVRRGTSEDFTFQGESFTLVTPSPGGLSRKERVRLEELKAVFFVKALEGNREYAEKKLQHPDRKMGKQVLVVFRDGESLRGTALGTNLTHHGFLLFPADPQSNNKRIFVVRSAVREIREE